MARTAQIALTRKAWPDALVAGRATTVRITPCLMQPQRASCPEADQDDPAPTPSPALGSDPLSSRGYGPRA
jgi:hypothetical protein